MTIGVEIASFSHREIDECPVDPRQGAYYAVGCRVPPNKVGLSDFENMWTGGVEEGSLSRISTGEGLVPNTESSFLSLAKLKSPVITPLASG